MYQSRTLKVLNTSPALIALVMLRSAHSRSAPANSAATLSFSYPSGFAGSSSAIRMAYEKRAGGQFNNPMVGPLTA